MVLYLRCHLMLLLLRSLVMMTMVIEIEIQTNRLCPRYGVTFVVRHMQHNMSQLRKKQNTIFICCSCYSCCCCYYYYYLLLVCIIIDCLFFLYFLSCFCFCFINFMFSCYEYKASACFVCSKMCSLFLLIFSKNFSHVFKKKHSFSYVTALDSNKRTEIIGICTAICRVGRNCYTFRRV